MSAQNSHHHKHYYSAFLMGLIFISLLLLMGCERNDGSSGGPGSPLKVRASISPEPIVGREVTWHIEIFSTGPEFQDATLRVELPEEVELVSGDPNWQGDIPANGTVAVDLVIRVITPGEWRVYAVASVIHDPHNSSTGWKALYITSSDTSAEVVEDINWTGTPIPTLYIATVTASSLSGIQTASGPNSVGGVLTLNGYISFTATILSPDPANPAGYLVSSTVKPLRRVRIEAWDEKLSQPGTYHYLSSNAYTNGIGFYTLVVSNVDPDGDGTGVDLRLRIYSTDDERVEVRDGNPNSVTPYAFQINLGDNLADGTQSFSYTATSSIPLEPFFIHDLTTNTGYEYLKNNTNWTNDDKVIFRWPTICVPELVVG